MTADTPDSSKGRQQAPRALRSHASNPPAAASPPTGRCQPRRLEPPVATCCLCGGRAPYGYFAKTYCRDHLPYDFWDVKRRAESRDLPAAGPAARQGHSVQQGQGNLF